MHRERDPQISGIHFISTLMRLMRIFICDSLVIFKVLQLLSNSNINNLFCNLDLDFWFSIRSVSLALSNRRRLKKKRVVLCEKQDSHKYIVEIFESKICVQAQLMYHHFENRDLIPHFEANTILSYGFRIKLSFVFDVYFIPVTVDLGFAFVKSCFTLVGCD